MTGWKISIVAYVMLAFTTSLVPGLPRLGITAEVVAGLDLPGSGLWIDEPHRAMAFGALYFLTLTLFELLHGPISFWRLRRTAETPRPAS